MEYKRVTQKKHIKTTRAKDDNRCRYGYRLIPVEFDANVIYGICTIHNDMDCKGDYVMGEEIDRLAELEDKIENGTLVELPCKVGDTVYCVYHFDDAWDEDFEYEIIPEEVVDIIVKEDNFDIGTACHMIGKFQRVCVCLTKSQAEEKLKELKK